MVGLHSKTQPTDPAGKHRKPQRVALRVMKLLKPHRFVVTLGLVLGVLGIVMNAFGPLLLGEATDLIFDGVTDKGDGGGIDFDRIGRVLLVLLTMYVLASLFMFVQGRMTATTVQLVISDLRKQVEVKLARLPLSHFDRNRSGDLLSRATNDVDNLQQTLQQSLAELITAVFSLVSMLGLMFFISPLLAVVMLASVPVSVVIVGFISARAQPQYAKQWAATGALSGHIEEMYTGHSLVKGFGRREEAERTFDEHNEALYQAGAKAQFISGTIEPSMMFTANLGYLVVAVVGALQVVNGSLSIGDVQAFILYSRQFSQPFVEIASVASKLQSGLASAERIFDLLDAREQRPDPADAERPVEVKGRVEFEYVSFHYTLEKRLIEGLSLTVEPGQTVAIVGPTGAGKSTLGNLLMRFYEVNGGRILLDGKDIAAMPREDLRRKIGLVLQDTWLFNGTIADNIAYGSVGATREEVVAAAQATHADRFIRTLPDGYDTVLDGESSNISAGEKQLITVARAFLAKPAILVLDEATSSVDTRTEVLIQRAMNSLRDGRTSFVIAHRLSTIRDADIIVVMESGRIVERGTHDELIAAGGMYARLHGSQAEAAPPPVEASGEEAPGAPDEEPDGGTAGEPTDKEPEERAEEPAEEPEPKRQRRTKKQKKAAKAEAAAAAADEALEGNPAPAADGGPSAKPAPAPDGEPAGKPADLSRDDPADDPFGDRPGEPTADIAGVPAG